MIKIEKCKKKNKEKSTRERKEGGKRREVASGEKQGIAFESHGKGTIPILILVSIEV